PLTELLDEVDLTLHLGSERPAKRWSTRPLMRLRESLFASEGYLERHGTPRTLEDLAGHMLLAGRSDEAQRWPLLDGGHLEIAPAMLADDPQLLRRFVGCGFGVALLPDVDLGERELDDEAIAPV